MANNSRFYTSRWRIGPRTVPIAGTRWDKPNYTNDPTVAKSRVCFTSCILRLRHYSCKPRPTFFDFTLSTQQTPAEAQQDFENAVGENGRLQLTVGDIVSATHLFSSGEEFDGALAGFSNLEWNVLMQDEAEEHVGTDHTNHKNSAFYEVTATNLRPLVINQLKPLLNNEVWQYISEEELLVVAESFFDFDIAEGYVSIAEIIEMPDTNQPGDSSMVVRVQEKLSSGQYAQMDYTVPVTIRPLQVSPKDPENPQEELHPEVMPELPENQGFLSIDFVPTIQFGDQEISYFAPETLYAEPLRTTANETRANFVQVSDRRGRNQSDGWRLSVKQREQFKNSGTGHVLAGASLQFHHIQAIAVSGQENQPTHSEQLSLLPGVSSTVAQAQAGSGLETWLFAFGTTDQADESVVLHLASNRNAKLEHMKPPWSGFFNRSLIMSFNDRNQLDSYFIRCSNSLTSNKKSFWLLGYFFCLAICEDYKREDSGGTAPH